VQEDMMLVVGVVILAFSIPAMVSAYSDSRPPRAAAVIFLIGAGLVAVAFRNHPGGYALAAIPDAFIRVIGHYLN
jgi:hypothetical protein